MATLSIEYGKTRNNGSRSVMLHIRSGKTEKRIPLNVSIDKSEFRTYPDGRIKITNDDKYFYIQDSLSDYKVRMNNILREYIGVDLSAEDLYRLMIAPNKADVCNMDFFDFADEWLEKSDIKGKKNYISMLNSLAKFVGIRRLSFASLSYQFLNDYLLYLKDKPRAQSLYLGELRHLYRQAALRYNTETDVKLSPYLFDRFKVPKQKVVGQRALSVEQLRAFFAIEPPTGRAELAIDCCKLSFCLMGTNSVDLFNATYFKKGIFAYDRTKTKDRRIDNAHIEIVVNDLILPLFEKYKSKDGKHVFIFAERYSDEAQFNRALNIGLRDIYKRYSGITGQKLQFYQFRHSWASVARNDLGADKGTIHESLNHVSRDFSIDDIYIKRDFRQINVLNAKVIDYIFGDSDKMK